MSLNSDCPNNDFVLAQYGQYDLEKTTTWCFPSSPSINAFASGDAAAEDDPLPIFVITIRFFCYCLFVALIGLLFGQSEFKDIDVATYELDQRGDGAAIQQTLLSMSGQRTVPSVWVGGKFVGGNSETQSAYKSGELQSMLGLK